MKKLSRDITLCHPELQEKAKRLIIECNKRGLKVMLGETFRTVEEQNALYAQGRTKPGSIVTYAKGSSYSSMHQWGIAFDVIRNDGKGAYYDKDEWFKRVGKIGKSLGLEWGGDWINPVDKPHFQLPYWGSTPDRLKILYGNVDNFKKLWNSYKSSAIEEDDEVVSEGRAVVNGKEYKIDRILKDNVNFIKAGNFGNMGFVVGYNNDTKAVVINNRIDDININVQGEDKTIKSVNIEGYNYVSIRELAETLGKSVTVENGKIVIS